MKYSKLCAYEDKSRFGGVLICHSTFHSSKICGKFDIRLIFTHVTYLSEALNSIQYHVPIHMKDLLSFSFDKKWNVFISF